jgi:hypothetical protein
VGRTATLKALNSAGGECPWHCGTLRAAPIA